MSDPTYPNAPGHRGVDTSVAAAEAVSHVAGSLRQRVYRLLVQAGQQGLTTDEIAATLGVPRYSAQPRTTELKHAHRIVDSKRRRRNASGCNAIVWITASVKEDA